MIKLINQVMKMGPRGVPKGFVWVQNWPNGKTPCLPHSLRALEWDKTAVIKCPNEDRATIAAKPFVAALFPKTFLNIVVAIVFPEFLSSSGVAEA